jgi:hypothetical protein
MSEPAAAAGLHDLPWNIDWLRRLTNSLILRSLPYIAIAKTYTQQGEFFIALRNAESAGHSPASAIPMVS